MKLNFNFFNNKFRIAFTLAEVLLAIAIVGVIAGLVMPATVSRAQNRSLDKAYHRNLQAVEDAVNSLIVAENKDFFKTEMYVNSTPSNYDDSSGKFLKKYFKVAKYCGSGTSARSCFANRYYKYVSHRKTTYTPTLNGACAKLKNGASICLTPQIGSRAIRGVIDVNGAKGPNVFERDIFTFMLSRKLRDAKDQTLMAVNVTTDTLDLDEEEGGTTPVVSPCSGVDLTVMNSPGCKECCEWMGALVDSREHACCQKCFQYKKGYHPICLEGPGLEPEPEEDPCDVPESAGCCAKQGVTASNKGFCCTLPAYQNHSLCHTLEWSCSCIPWPSRHCSCTVVKRYASNGKTEDITTSSGYRFSGRVCLDVWATGRLNNPCVMFHRVPAGQSIPINDLEESSITKDYYVKECSWEKDGESGYNPDGSCSGTIDLITR